MDIDLKKKIEDILSKDRIVLFMKGTPDFPQCGFSARAVHVLKKSNIKFGYFDVLEDNDVREGIKEYGDFQTLPQLYADKTLIGGSDILVDMSESGEIEEKLLKT